MLSALDDSGSDKIMKIINGYTTVATYRQTISFIVDNQLHELHNLLSLLIIRILMNRARSRIGLEKGQ